MSICTAVQIDGYTSSSFVYHHIIIIVNSVFCSHDGYTGFLPDIKRFNVYKIFPAVYRTNLHNSKCDNNLEYLRQLVVFVTT